MKDIANWTSSLPEEWTRGCSPAVFELACAAYDSPPRFYHTWNHILDCTEKFRTFPCESGRAVFLALLFHDAVYVAGKLDNETKSGAFALQVLREHSSIEEGELTHIERMILATRDHRLPPGEASVDLAATLDIDMSILGAPWEQYSRYAEGVRREYCPTVTTESRFAVGRSVFLSKLLDSSAIFHTPEGVALWEGNARQNISRELRTLRSSQGLISRLIARILR